jgi:hypothetical protein
MIKMKQWLVLAGITAVLSLATLPLAAQDRDRDRGRGGFDPAQMRERMMERYKEQLEIKDEGEWKAIQPLIQKVMETRLQSMSGMGRGMFGRSSRPGDDNDQNRDQNRDRDRGRSMFGQPSPEADSLQKAIDGKASNSEMKAALARYQEARKAKQAELEKSQAELRKVLTVRQEAIATMSGLL